MHTYTHSCTQVHMDTYTHTHVLTCGSQVYSFFILVIEQKTFILAYDFFGKSRKKAVSSLLTLYVLLWSMRYKEKVWVNHWINNLKEKAMYLFKTLQPSVGRQSYDWSSDRNLGHEAAYVKWLVRMTKKKKNWNLGNN